MRSGIKRALFVQFKSVHMHVVLVWHYFFLFLLCVSSAFNVKKAPAHITLNLANLTKWILLQKQLRSD